MKTLVLGTRGSRLAVIQKEIVERQLRLLLPDTAIATKIITTKGDKDMQPVPLDSVGKGWFTKEIDKALYAGDIDIAVHSLKDLPEELPEGLIIAAIPQREDAREVLVARENFLFRQLPKGAVIGTDSTRRKSQILHQRPDLIVESIRGNVLTRIEKLDRGDYDGVFLAFAGLKRLGLEKRIAEIFPVTEFIPSPGQGALAIVIKKANKALAAILKKLNHQNSVIAVTAERAFSKVIGGGCKMPVGAYAECDTEQITIHGVIGSIEGEHLEKKSLSGDVTEANAIATELAQSLLNTSAPWYSLSRQDKKYIVVTMPDDANQDFKKRLEAIGADVFLYPTIAVAQNKISSTARNTLKQIDDFDWLIFTSNRGVRYFIEILNNANIDLQVIRNKRIAAVGPRTQAALEEYALSVNLVPDIFTADTLAKELKDIAGKKILLPQSTIANPSLAKKLQEKGASVTKMPVYKTENITGENQELQTLIETDAIQFLTFASPSAVKGFVKSLPEKVLQKALTLLVVSIGPVTTKAAKKYGFVTIYTADIHTVDGMLIKIQENTL